MDSSNRIDYALFQLTPTRTRCDLVAVCGGHKEKVASGLLEPFISHLRSAKEQISKGGYSITLRAPTVDAPWFTKGTLERFVRFVSTPEVLERFVTIEREISQIECSVQSNELSEPTFAEEVNTTAADGVSKKLIVPFKPKGESDGNGDAVHEENSKHRLQRVLEARKAVLRREQAMAYARAFAAGFEMDHIDDLIFFSDAFGASRLREACINFKELCRKKHNDGLWMDELAAMEACQPQELPYFGTSGIMLASENNSSTQSIMQNFQNGLSKVQLERNGSPDASMSESITSHASSDATQGQMPPVNTKAQLPMQWPNQLPPYMYNFQGPAMAQMPPYQGYPFPGMQVVPPYYQGNMQWPPNPEEYGEGKGSDNHQNHKSSRKKEKSSNGKESEISEQDGHTNPFDLTSGSDSDAYLQTDRKNSTKSKPHKRSNGKKSSRMVVIRNINYITSDRRDGEDGASDESSHSEDEFIDGDSLKQKVEDAVGTLTKNHKSNPRHFKKKGKNKKLSGGGESNDVVDQDLESDQSANIDGGSKTNENWDAFQSLLMRDDDTGPYETDKQNSLDVQHEYFSIHGSKIEQRKKMVANDSFIVTGRAGDEGSKHLESFESNEKFNPSMKKREDPSEELLFSQRMEGGRAGIQDPLSDFATELPVHKTRKGEDWFIVNQLEKSEVRNVTVDYSNFNSDHALGLDGNNFYAEKTKKDVLADDSFMIQSQPMVQEQFDSQWKTDISVITDLSQNENGTSSLPGDKLKVPGPCEPDDLCMVLERESGVESAGASWSHEIDYGLDLSVAEANKHSGAGADGVVDDSFEITDNKKNGESETKPSGKELRSKAMRGSPGKNKQEIISRTRKPSTISRPVVHKSKLEKEEEARKRMEELVIQRQKRIAERSAASGLTSAKSNRASVESKGIVSSVKDHKKMKQSSAQETKRLNLHKPSITSSTAERLSSVQVKHKEPSTPSKSTQPTKTTPKVNGASAATLSPNTAKNDNKKSNTSQEKPSQQQNGTLSSLSDIKEKNQQSNGMVDKLETKNARANAIESTEDKELNEQSPRIMKTEDNKIINGRKEPIVQQDPSISTRIESCKIENDNRDSSKSAAVLHEERAAHQPSQIKEFIVAENLHAVPKKDQDCTGFNQEEDISETNQTFATTEISELEIAPDAFESTPPPTSELSPDQIHTRKKWISNDSLPPATKGIKKLLMFGRKKAQLSA